MIKRIAAESEVRHGQTYWQIVDYDEECVIAELGCSEDAEALAEEIVKRWDAYVPPRETGPGDDDEPDYFELACGVSRKQRDAAWAKIELDQERRCRAFEEAKGK